MKETYDTSKLAMFVDVWQTGQYIHAGMRIRTKANGYLYAYEYPFAEFALASQGEANATGEYTRLYGIEFKGEINTANVDKVAPALLKLNKSIAKFLESSIEPNTFGGIVFMLAKCLKIDTVFLERKKSGQNFGGGWQDNYTPYAPKDSVYFIDARVLDFNPNLKTCDKLAYR